MNIVAKLEQQRKLLALALPMIFSNITTPLLGLVDTAVIGPSGSNRDRTPPAHRSDRGRRCRRRGSIGRLPRRTRAQPGQRESDPGTLAGSQYPDLRLKFVLVEVSLGLSRCLARSEFLERQYCLPCARDCIGDRCSKHRVGCAIW